MDKNWLYIFFNVWLDVLTPFNWFKKPTKLDPPDLLMGEHELGQD